MISSGRPRIWSFLSKAECIRPYANPCYEPPRGQSGHGFDGPMQSAFDPLKVIWGGITIAYFPLLVLKGIDFSTGIKLLFSPSPSLLPGERVAQLASGALVFPFLLESEGLGFL